MHILLLLTEEALGDRVERVGRETVLVLHDGEHVDHHTPIDGDVMRLSVAHLVAVEGRGCDLDDKGGGIK